MLNTTKITFRCKHPPYALYTPEFMFDVEDMRRHPDYEEVIVTETGEVIAREDREQPVKRVPLQPAEARKPRK